jgi:peptidoglycan hydrolase-like protein with peptidoglycan-binding domain
MKPKLSYGSRGAFVSEVQAKLNLLLPFSVPPLVIDGVYGAKSVQRMKEFQRTRGLVADGIVGAKTWATLDGAAATAPRGAPPPPPPVPGPTSPHLRAVRVHGGAMLSCSCGLAPSILRIGEPGRAEACVRDSIACMNLGPFGMCQSLANPAVAAATSAAQGAFTPQPCVPIFTGPWSPGMPVQMVGTPPAPALGMNSLISCAWGGLVRIVTPGK